MKYIWENPAIFKENKEDGHVIAFSHDDEKKAIYREESIYKFSISGTWKFHWAKGVEEFGESLKSVAYDCSEWEDITVPGVWQMQKDYSNPLYYANSYPNAISTKKSEIPKIDHKLQEVAIYRRECDVPITWGNREIFMHFGAVKAGMKLYINGRYVGYSQGSFTPHEFNITPFVHAGINTVAAEVYRYSDGTYLEDQDMWFASGIYRDVYVFSEEKTCIRDFFIKTKLINNYKDSNVDVAVQINAYDDEKTATVEAFIVDDGTKTEVGSDSAVCKKGATNFNFSKLFEGVKLWSSETPTLYTLLIKLTVGEKSTYKAIRFGFKEIEIRGERILANGQPLLIRGVNRHDFDPDSLWAVPDERYIQDLNIMKRNNINSIRTSHYPNDPRFYDYCDEYGFWVMDECDLETHGVRRKGVPGDNPMWTDAVVDRMQRMVLRDRNHACVFMWSLGNEAGDGSNFLKMKEAALELDDTRQFHYEGDFDFTKSDVISRMYPMSDLVEKLGNREEVAISAFDNIANALAADSKPIKKSMYTKPVVFCEFAHCMENSLGNFQEYMDAFEKYDNLCGGWIWDFCDQALHQKTEDGEDAWLYGNDFDEKDSWLKPPYNVCAITGSNGCFNANGIIAADRKVHPAIHEVKKVYAEICVDELDKANGEFLIKNKQLFSDLNKFNLEFTVTVDGEIHAKTLVPNELFTDIKPLSEKKLIVDYGFDTMPQGEVIVTFSFLLKEKCRWADAGFEQNFSQFIIKETEKTIDEPKVGVVEIIGTQEEFEVIGDNFKYKFKNGLLYQMIKEGRVYLDKAIAPNYYRAMTDNDVDFVNFTPPLMPFHPLLGLKSATNNCKTKAGFIHKYAHTAYIETNVNTSCVKNAKLIYTVYPDGKIKIKHEGQAKTNLLRFGFKLELEKDKNMVSWYGAGPHENYIDRKTGAKIAKYEMSVEDLEHHYMRPQENGHRCDVREMSITNSGNSGFKFTAVNASSFGFNAHHYTVDELDAATHIHTFKHSDLTEICIDAQQRGVGGDTPGNAALREPYKMQKGDKFSVEVMMEIL